MKEVEMSVPEVVKGRCRVMPAHGVLLELDKSPVDGRDAPTDHEEKGSDGAMLAHAGNGPVPASASPTRCELPVPSHHRLAVQ